MMKAEGISSQLEFCPTVAAFEHTVGQAPSFSEGRVYYMYILLQAGGFKFQSALGTKHDGYFVWDGSRNIWLKSQLTLVVRPVFEAVDEHVAYSGWLELRTGRRRMLGKGGSVTVWAVLQPSCMVLRDDIQGAVLERIPVGDRGARQSGKSTFVLSGHQLEASDAKARGGWVAAIERAVVVAAAAANDADEEDDFGFGEDSDGDDGF